MLSDEEGIRFVRPGNSADDDALQLGYGPAWVEDARGPTIIGGDLSLTGKKLTITVPQDLAARRPTIPVVIDPVIGPSQLVGSLQGEASGSRLWPPMARTFLTVWSWNGDIYGQRVDDDRRSGG